METKLKNLFKGDQFATMIGAELIEMKDGHAKAQLKITPQHWNGANLVHGGAIFTLADLAFAGAANSRGKLAVSLNSTISFISAVSDGIIYAEAKEISLHERVSVYHVDVRCSSGTLIASFEGTAYRKNVSL